MHSRISYKYKGFPKKGLDPSTCKWRCSVPSLYIENLSTCTTCTETVNSISVQKACLPGLSIKSTAHTHTQKLVPSQYNSFTTLGIWVHIQYRLSNHPALSGTVPLWGKMSRVPLRPWFVPRLKAFPNSCQFPSPCWRSTTFTYRNINCVFAYPH